MELHWEREPKMEAWGSNWLKYEHPIKIKTSTDTVKTPEGYIAGMLWPELTEYDHFCWYILCLCWESTLIKYSHSLNPDYTVPSHGQLSVDILNSAYKDVQRGNMQKQRGKMGTRQCDRWKDITKNHLQGFMVYANGMVSTRQLWIMINTESHIVSPHSHPWHICGAVYQCKSPRVDGERKGVYQKGVGNLIGWTLDAGPDSKKAHTDLVKKYPHLLETDCIAHQVWHLHLYQHDNLHILPRFSWS